MFDLDIDGQGHEKQRRRLHLGCRIDSPAIRWNWQFEPRPFSVSSLDVRAHILSAPRVKGREILNLSTWESPIISEICNVKIIKGHNGCQTEIELVIARLDLTSDVICSRDRNRTKKRETMPVLNALDCVASYRPATAGLWKRGQTFGPPIAISFRVILCSDPHRSGLSCFSPITFVVANFSFRSSNWNIRTRTESKNWPFLNCFHFHFNLKYFYNVCSHSRWRSE